VIGNPEKGDLEQTCSLWQDGRSGPGVRERASVAALASSFSPEVQNDTVETLGLAVRSLSPHRECLLPGFVSDEGKIGVGR